MNALTNARWTASTLIMDYLRDRFRCGLMTETEFRRQLKQRGYTDYGADAEVRDIDLTRALDE